MPKEKGRVGGSGNIEQGLEDEVLALLPPENAHGDRSVRQIAVDRISVNSKQPRLALPPLATDELTASIREHGVLQPIIVRPTEPGSYQIVAGERRWRAVLSLGLPLIPAIVEAMSDEIALEIAIIENLQREDLSPLDEAAIFSRMTTDLGYSIRKLAERIGKDKGYVENRLRLVHAPADIRALVAERSDTISHAYELMKISDQSRRSELAAQVLRGELSLARLKSVVREELPAEVPAPEIAPPSLFPYAAPRANATAATSVKPIAVHAAATVSRETTSIAPAADAALTTAREDLATAIDTLANVLHEIDQPTGGAALSATDRANMAKWLLIARNKLDNLAAILRQKAE
ncbi:MAG: ParB/RepB/Spo0J family partition protein [Chloroflexi bacterium]|nr:ParB/RepB/Spo0J family partition protein [Chloroflexota bacterium]